MKRAIFFILGIIFELSLLIIIASEFTQTLGVNFVIFAQAVYPFVFLITVALGTFGIAFFNKKACNSFFTGMLVGFILYMGLIVFTLEPIRF